MALRSFVATTLQTTMLELYRARSGPDASDRYNAGLAPPSNISCSFLGWPFPIRGNLRKHGCGKCDNVIHYLLLAGTAVRFLLRTWIQIYFCARMHAVSMFFFGCKNFMQEFY